MKHIFKTIEHKWYVLKACLILGVPLRRALAHDLSKFSAEELPHYERQFYGDKADPEGFARAWLHHQNTNPHHWEYWVTRSDHTKGKSGAVNGCLEMPETYVREMVADWMGASKAYTGEWYMAKWLMANLPKVKLHPNTRALVGEILEKELGYTDNFK